MRHPAVIPMTVARLACTACGAEANASCSCGKPYVPAKQRAAEKIAENPKRSDRDIAAELNVSPMTVGRARKEAGVTDVTPERLGQDGKVYRLPVRDDTPDEEDVFVEKMFMFSTEGVIEAANDALRYLGRARLQDEAAIRALKIADDIIAKWNEVKSFIESNRGDGNAT